MADDYKPLSDDERAELEELRAEKARRQQAEKARRERAELERLRAEKAHGQAEPRRRAPAAGQPPQRAVRRRTVTPEEAAQIERDKELRERNAKIMEPDDDLNMPLAQKIVLIGVLAAAVIAVLAIIFGPH